MTRQMAVGAAVLLMALAGCLQTDIATPPGMAGRAPLDPAFQPVTAALDGYQLRLGFADGRRCTIPAYPGNRNGTEGGWSRYETDCPGIDGVRIDWLPLLRPGPPDPNIPELPTVVPDYTGTLVLVGLPGPDIEGADVTIRGAGGTGTFLNWPERDG